MITSLSDWFKVLSPLFQPIRSETKTNRGSHVHIFPALCRLRVITASFDWFTGLSPFFLIGRSNYFGFGFRLKLALFEMFTLIISERLLSCLAKCSVPASVPGLRTSLRWVYMASLLSSGP